MEKNEFHVRTLKEIDNAGREKSIHVVYDLDALVRKHFPELANEKQNKKGEVVLLPTPSQPEPPTTEPHQDKQD